MTQVQIIRARAELIPSFRECLDSVAREKIFIDLTEAPPLEGVHGFQMALISSGAPVTYAVDRDRVIGWCDIIPEKHTRHCHRGRLGMGLLKDFRGQGIGGLLLSSTIEMAKLFGLEKIELNVYSSNEFAIRLYKKFGFSEEGLIRHYRKLDGQYFDSVAMAKFLK